MQSNLLTVRQFSERHPAFSEGSLRWMIFCAHDSNSAYAGLERAIVRVGRKVLIDEELFFDWIRDTGSRQ